MELPPQPAEKYSTRPRQFETMVTFMEEHGDISMARAQSTRNRLALLHTWERLRAVLNAQADGGPSRTLDKWKKVWSDLKNNTKKKAQRLARAQAAGAGAGGAGSKSRLTKLELRVLKIMGMVKQPVVGSPRLPEPPPLKAAPVPSAKLDLTRLSPTPPPEDLFEITFDSWGRQVSQDPLISTKVDAESQNGADLTLEDSFLYSTPRLPSPQTEDRAVPGDSSAGSPALAEEQGASPRPDDRGHTNTRGVVVSSRSSLSRVLVALSRVERARRRDHARRERTRRAERARELRLQRGWQRICERGLTLMERYLDSKIPGRAPAPSEVPKQTSAESQEAPEDSVKVPGNPEEASEKMDVLEEEASVEVLDEAPEEMELHRPLVVHPERLL